MLHDSSNNQWNNHYICWNNEEVYGNNGLKHWEQKNRIMGKFINIIGSSLMNIVSLVHVYIIYIKHGGSTWRLVNSTLIVQYYIS